MNLSSQSAELAIVGSLILDGSMTPNVLAEVEPTDFTDYRARCMFDAIKSLASEQRDNPETVIDQVTVAGRLELTHPGEYDWPVEIIDAYVDVPNAYSVIGYARQVKDLSKRRKMIKISSESAKAAGDIETPIIDSIPGIVRDLGGLTAGAGRKTTFTLSESIEAIINTAETFALSGQLPVIPTPFGELNTYLNGGWERGKLFALLGVPGMGKSTLGGQFATYPGLFHEYHTVQFHCEMNHVEMTSRMIGARLGINPNELLRGTIGTDSTRMDLLINEYRRLKDAKVTIDQTPGIRPAEMRARLYSITNNIGPVDLVMVDYFQLMRPDNPRLHGQDRYEDVVDGLMGIAKEFNVPVIVLSQVLDKAIANRMDKRPNLEDVWGTPLLGNAVEGAFSVFRPARYSPEMYSPLEAELNVVKNRKGPLGRINLAFDPGSNVYTEAETLSL